MAIVPYFAPGDHIRLNCGAFDHHAIFCNWEQRIASSATVIHHRGKQQGGCIDKETQNVAGYTLVTRPVNPNVVLRRAHSRIGERGYNLVFKNCEDVALWCISGDGSSYQIARHTSRCGKHLMEGAPAACRQLLGAELSISARSMMRRTGVALVATELAWEALRSIRDWMNGDISGERCVKGIVDACGAVGGGLAEGLAGGFYGAIGGPIGVIVGTVVGGALGQHLASSLTQTLTSTFFDLPKHVAVENAYRLLGINQHASNEDVNRAYRQKALHVHPDRPGGSHEAFVQLQNALEIIRAERDGL